MINFINNSEKKRKLINLLIWVPVINILATLATNHNIGFGSFHLGYVRGVLLTLIGLYILLIARKNNTFYALTMLILVYTAVMCLFSSDITQSLIVWNKFFISTTLFFVGFYIVHNTQDYTRLIKTTYFSIAIVLIYIFISNLFGFGEVSYRGGTILFGETGVNIVKTLGIGIILSPLIIYFSKKKQKKWFLAITIISVLVLLLGLKRGVILAVLIGFITFIIYSPFKIKYIKLLPVILILSIPLIFLFEQDILSTYDGRVEKLKSDSIIKTGSEDEAEGRTVELMWVLKRFNDGDIGFKLFGEDPLIARKNALGVRGDSRMNHMDFSSVLDSFGIIGFILLTMWYLRIIRWIFKLKRRINYKQNKEILAVILALFTAQIPFAISGSIVAIDLRGLLMLHLGALIALVVKFHNQSQSIKAS